MALSYRHATHLGGISSSRAVQLQRPFTVARPQGLRRPCAVVVRAAAEPQADVKPEAAPAPPAPARRPPQNYVVDDSFSLKKVSFGGVLTPIGVSLLVYGFCAYFQFLPGVDLSAVMLIYGFPLTLLGFALSYTALAPVSLKSTQEALNLRDSQATDNQKQVREDCTRFRYGDEQHLDEALQKIFRYGRSGGIPRKDAPTLVGLREEVIDGAYTLVMEFSSKLDLATWQERQPKFQSFFGPGVIAQMEKSSQGVDVLLISDRSGRGRGGAEKLDPLMPLMPGLPPRKQ